MHTENLILRFKVKLASKPSRYMGSHNLALCHNGGGRFLFFLPSFDAEAALRHGPVVSVLNAVRARAVLKGRSTTNRCRRPQISANDT